MRTTGLPLLVVVVAIIIACIITPVDGACAAGTECRGLACESNADCGAKGFCYYKKCSNVNIASYSVYTFSAIAGWYGLGLIILAMCVFTECCRECKRQQIEEFGEKVIHTATETAIGRHGASPQQADEQAAAASAAAPAPASDSAAAAANGGIAMTAVVVAPNNESALAAAPAPIVVPPVAVIEPSAASAASPPQPLLVPQSPTSALGSSSTVSSPVSTGERVVITWNGAAPVDTKRTRHRSLKSVYTAKQVLAHVSFKDINYEHADFKDDGWWSQVKYYFQLFLGLTFIWGLVSDVIVLFQAMFNRYWFLAGAYSFTVIVSFALVYRDYTEAVIVYDNALCSPLFLNHLAYRWWIWREPRVHQFYSYISRRLTLVDKLCIWMYHSLRNWIKTVYTIVPQLVIASVVYSFTEGKDFLGPLPLICKWLLGGYTMFSLVLVGFMFPCMRCCAKARYNSEEMTLRTYIMFRIDKKLTRAIQQFKNQPTPAQQTAAELAGFKIIPATAETIHAGSLRIKPAPDQLSRTGTLRAAGFDLSQITAAAGSAPVVRAPSTTTLNSRSTPPATPSPAATPAATPVVVATPAPAPVPGAAPTPIATPAAVSASEPSAAPQTPARSGDAVMVPVESIDSAPGMSSP